MRTTLFKTFLFGILLCMGCDNPTTIVLGNGGGSDYLAYLQAMNKIRVEFIGNTLFHFYTKQGSRDGGKDLDWWLVRKFEFQNRDTTYVLQWQDSQFTTHTCFSLSEVDAPYTFASGCADVSLTRGIYHSSTQTLSNLLCLVQSLVGGADPDNYLSINASLQTAPLDFETASEDSVSFTIRNWTTRSVLPAYNYDELSMGTYSKKNRLTAFDSLGRDYSPVCRVVFSK